MVGETHCDRKKMEQDSPEQLAIRLSTLSIDLLFFRPRSDGVGSLLLSFQGQDSGIRWHQFEGKASAGKQCRWDGRYSSDGLADTPWSNNDEAGRMHHFLWFWLAIAVSA